MTRISSVSQGWQRRPPRSAGVGTLGERLLLDPRSSSLDSAEAARVRQPRLAPLCQMLSAAGNGQYSRASSPAAPGAGSPAPGCGVRRRGRPAGTATTPAGACCGPGCRPATAADAAWSTGAVGEQIELPLLDAILHLPACSIGLCVQPLGRGPAGREMGARKARVQPRGQVFRLARRTPVTAPGPVCPVRAGAAAPAGAARWHLLHLGPERGPTVRCAANPAPSRCRAARTTAGWARGRTPHPPGW